MERVPGSVPTKVVSSNCSTPADHSASLLDSSAQIATTADLLLKAGFSDEQIRNIRDAYRVLYRSDLKLAEALARLEPQAARFPEIRTFVDFIHASTRSIVR